MSHERKRHPSVNEEFSGVMLAIGFSVILGCVAVALFALVS